MTVTQPRPETVTEIVAETGSVVQGRGALTRDGLREQLRLPRLRNVVWDNTELLEPCPSCGHWEHLEELAAPPSGPLVEDVRPDRSALLSAAWTVVLVVEVLDGRRPARQITGVVAPRVLRYLAAVPAGRSGSCGGVRLLSVHPHQPHEGAVEVAASLRLAGRRRAMAASFALFGVDSWVCETVRIL
ncbi:Rv3235 family protein [Pseudonocardia sp. WMMC193]|uniref:Rv3235 family protein n=1 Tax=Pseudonocardia sp. WMMC193 TaxID=2911965 RepID=UPI001F3F9F61|nr:Rv3235 family protein [Pseudonocardia sp. WMMC193]MCF7547464.1 Rv3235 family protein [Pseudonocardia sp. WMMC193]